MPAPPASSPLEVVVVGAGPVGCAAALGLAQRGCHVRLCDGRPDPRPAGAASAAAVQAQRSVNLAISTRGLAGLSALTPWAGGDAPVSIHRGPGATQVVRGAPLVDDLAQTLLDQSVPMRGRMIHTEPTRSVDAAGCGKDDLVAIAADPGKVGSVRDSQAYAPLTGDAINSIDRGRLNNVLLAAAASHPLIDVFFGHKLSQTNLEAGDSVFPVRAEFIVTGGPSTTFDCDTVIGCDGHHSRVRAQLARYFPRFDFEQLWIDSGYVELSIPARSQHPDEAVRKQVPSFQADARRRLDGVKGKTVPSGKNDVDDSEFLLDPNHLHIWPRHQFMLIALPNRDGSFTSTLFAPFSLYARYLTPAALAGDDGSSLDPAKLNPPLAPGQEVGPASQIAFFRKHFPDALALLTEDGLVRHLSTHRPSSLAVVRCAPYNYKERALILGDAAHAQVPFYGQGLNAGLEDVRVLLEHIDAAISQSNRGPGLLSAAHDSLSSDKDADLAEVRKTLRSAFEAYNTSHAPDSHAIVDLSLNNYHEMASKVVSVPFRLRRRLDAALMTILPTSRWQSLYTMVTFSTRPYAEVTAVRDWQDSVVHRAVEGALTLGAGAAVIAAGIAAKSFWTSRQ